MDGIGPKRRKRIARAWQEARLVREIMLFLHSHGVTTSRAVGYSRPTGSRQSRRCERTRICWRRTPTGSASRPPTRSLRRSGFPKIRLTGRGLELTTCCWRRPRTVTVLFRWRKLELAATKLLETAEATVEQALSQMLTSGSAVIRGNRRRAADLPALLEKGGRCADVQIIAVFQVVHVTQTANHESALPTLGAFHTGRSNQPKGRKRVHSSTQISMPQCSRPHFYVLFADRPCLSFLTFNETRSSHNPKVGGSNPPPATIRIRVRSGDIGNRTFRRHRLHFWPEGVLQGLQSFFLQINVTEIVIHKTD